LIGISAYLAKNWWSAEFVAERSALPQLRILKFSLIVDFYKPDEAIMTAKISMGSPDKLCDLSYFANWIGPDTTVEQQSPWFFATFHNTPHVLIPKQTVTE